MNDVEQASLNYYQSFACSEQWAEFLHALASELQAQMSPEENRAFFYVLGGRIAARMPLPGTATLEAFERSANERFRQIRWGWTQIRDVHSSLEIVHHCAPFRQAFGDAAMAWSSGLLEGVYSYWLKQLGAGQELQLRQVGHADAASDTLQFRFAHASLFM